MYDLLPVSWARVVLRCTICCRCLGLEAGSECEDVRFVGNVLGSKRGPDAKMNDLLPVSWARSGVRMLRRAICCRCLGLEAGSECFGVGFVGDVLFSKRGPNAKMYDLLPVSWARSRVRMLRCRSCCRCRGLEAASECFDVQVAAGILGSKQGRNAKMYDLLPVSWARSGVRMLRCAISCRCLGLEAGSEC